MRNKMKNSTQSMGDDTGDFASRFGSHTADFARRFGDRSSELVNRVGPGRALVGIALFGAILGGSLLIIRYLRARRDELPYEVEGEERGRSFWNREDRRGMRRGDTRNAY